MTSLKTRLRDLIPAALQVPVKYWYGRARGSLEPEMKLLRMLTQSGDRVIDVGGNRGVYAYEFWRLGCVVEIFEPNPLCCLVLRSWAGEKPNVSIHPVALSSTEGQATLHIPRDSSGVEHDASASIEHSVTGEARDEIVATRTLDSYQFASATFIKIDVEGHEMSVIQGAASTLRRCKPTLLIEIEQRHNQAPLQQVFDAVASHGYEGYFLHRDRLHPLQKFDTERDQSMAEFGKPSGTYVNNFLFVHRGRPLPLKLGAMLP